LHVNTGKTGRAWRGARQGRVSNGWLHSLSWTYAADETQRDLIAAVRRKGNARLDLKITESQGKNTGDRIISAGPMPRLLLNAADVYSDIRMFHLTQYGLDLIEDDSVSDAMSMSSVTVFISTR
jgi:hypothetical protein